jgi:hypothetical protein
MLFGESVVLCPGSECFLVNAAHANESQTTQPIALDKCSSMGKIHPRREKLVWTARSGEYRKRARAVSNT